MREYTVGSSRVRLVFGDLTKSKAEVLVSSDDYMLSMGGGLTKSKAEVLVSSDDYMLSMGGGVSAAIRLAGGNRVALEASKMVPARRGDVVVTSAGDLDAKYVMHAITIGPWLSDSDDGVVWDPARQVWTECAAGEREIPDEVVVRQVTRKVIRLLPHLGCRSVAFPAIGTGVAGIPYNVVASQMAAELVSVLLETGEGLDVEIYLYDRFHSMRREDFYMFFEEFACRTLGLSAAHEGEKHTFIAPAEGRPGGDPDAMREAQRRHEVFSLLRRLDVRRNQLETALVSALGDESTEAHRSITEIRAKLEELQRLRFGYESELAEGGGAPSDASAKSVFLSSTSVDLRPHREAVRERIERLALRYIGMEDFVPTALPPAELIRKKVNDAQVYLGVIGLRYGYVEPSSGISMTELEYRQALASNKEVLVFVMDKSAPITVEMVESDPTAYAKLLDFRSRVMNSNTCAMFERPDDLAEKAERALTQLKL
jgi:O-acetyl-ADP-ribose deacetylase (regulator of RNase III)